MSICYLDKIINLFLKKSKTLVLLCDMDKEERVDKKGIQKR